MISAEEQIQKRIKVYVGFVFDTQNFYEDGKLSKRIWPKTEQKKMQKLWGVQRFRLYKGELQMTVQGKK